MHFHHVWMHSIENKRFSPFSLHLQTISVRRCVRFSKRAFVNKRLGNVSFRRIYATRLFLRGRLFVRGIPGVRSTLETLDSRKINERGEDMLVYIMFGLEGTPCDKCSLFFDRRTTLDIVFLKFE